MPATAISVRMFPPTQLLLVSVLLLIGATAKAQQTSSVSAPPMTYSNQVAETLLQRAQEISHALTKDGFLPSESFTNATVRLEGQSVHPSALVLGSCCEYWFHEGALSEIRRNDLFENKGPKSLILRHLTNEVLTLTTAAATNRVLEFFRLLGFDPDRLQQVYHFAVSDDKMTATPIRDGGPDFPKDLHFFGELISREKIKIETTMTLVQPNDVEEPARSLHPYIELLATTGELLNAGLLPDAKTLDRLGVRGPDQITIGGASDFSPPTFTFASKKWTGAETAPPSEGVASLVRQAWADLQEKLGAAEPRCILVCDNLNDPRTVAAQLTTLAGKTRWAGASYFFDFDLPFDRAQIESLAEGKRGIGLLAISGGSETQIQLLKPATNFDNLNSETPDQKRKHLAPGVDEMLDRLRLPTNVPDHLLFVLPIEGDDFSVLVKDEMTSRWQDRARIVQAGGRAGRSAYFNGAISTNGVIVLRISGYLPLRGNLRNLFPSRSPQPRQQTRSISFKAITPVSDFLRSFDGHPLELLVDIFGADRLRVLHDADKLEVFEIKSGNAPAGSSSIEGHEIVTQGKTLGRDSAQKLSLALPLDITQFDATLCGWHPVVVFRAWKGKESASLTVCFQCNEAMIVFYDAHDKPISIFYDADGKPISSGVRFTFSERETLLELARKSLPDSRVISSISK